jgi:hypothetical protein
MFHYTAFNEDYISIYTLWLVPLPFLYCVLAGLVAWRLNLSPLSSDLGFAPGASVAWSTTCDVVSAVGERVPMGSFPINNCD